MSIADILAKRAAEKNQTTELQSSVNAVTVKPDAVTPIAKPVAPIPENKKFSGKYAKNYLHKIMIPGAGWFYPTADGFYIPETNTQKEQCEWHAGQGRITPIYE